MSRIYSDENDPLCSDSHMIDFGYWDENGGFRATGSSGVLPGSIGDPYVGWGGADGWLASNVDLWKDLPGDLSGYKGYNYDSDDLKMRYNILNDPDMYHGFKTTLYNWEAGGWAEPLTGKNYWDAYGQTLGTMRAAEVYVGAAAGLAGGAQKGYFGTPRQFNYTTTGKTVPKELGYTNKTSIRMNDPNRHVPMQIQRQLIRNSNRLWDTAHGAHAYQGQMFRNGQYYNLRVVYHPLSNQVYHFHYW